MAFHIDANQRLACPPSEEAVSPSKNPLTEAQGYLAACSISLRYAGSSTVTAEPDMLKGEKATLKATYTPLNTGQAATWCTVCRRL